MHSNLQIETYLSKKIMIKKKHVLTNHGNEMVKLQFLITIAISDTQKSSQIFLLMFTVLS